MTDQASSWLTAELLQKILRKSESDQTIEVKNITTESATAKGDNYASTMLRVKVTYSFDKFGCRETKTLALIFKISPMVEGAQKDLIIKCGVFQKESLMLETTLVMMNDLLNDLPDEAEHCQLGPRVLYSDMGDPSFLVMEDLAQLGYRMANRQAGLDLSHSLLAIGRLAKLHACSVALCEKDPFHKENYLEGFFHEDTPEELKNFITRGIRTLGVAVVDWPELGSDGLVYSEKLLKLSEVYFAKFAKCMKANPNEFNVINHGDCWVNNMLFRYNDEGEIIDHVFVDYQGSHWNSPVLDILTLLCASLSEDVDLHHRDTLVAEYQKVLTQTMSKLGCKTIAPTLDVLHETIKQRHLFTVGMSCMALPVILVDSKEAPDLSELLEKADDCVTSMYDSPKLRRILVRRLRLWDAEGLLQC